MRERDVQNHSAQYYTQRYTGLGRRYHTEIVDWMMEGMSGKLLDAGCGTGFVNLINPGKDITGIDLSPGMLARHYFPWHAQEMDVCTMSFPPGTFDGIICRSLLHHLPNHQRGLSEMARVLKPEGRIAFWEPSRSLLAKRIRKWTQHGDRFSEYHRSFTVKELIYAVQKEFQIDEVQYIGFFCYPIYGFSDILNFQRFIPGNRVIYPFLQQIDQYLSRTPWLKHLSWSIGIRAHKVPKSLTT